ncbi:MAG: AAA family ATPase, partial [Planctomycetales bacterium]|nr:AAA family ATPase [Planctomycetales bacterium]
GIELTSPVTFLVGENGSGKTSLLDALAVALGVWLLDVPDSEIANSQRPIYPGEIRLEPRRDGDRTLFSEAWNGVEIRASGEIDEQAVHWTREIPMGKERTSNHYAQETRTLIRSLYDRSQHENVLLPVIAYYGAGRGWLSHRERKKKTTTRPARRWAAFYDCLNERIRVADLVQWFRDETTAAGNRQGRFRPGFEAVRRAVLRCVPGADGIWFDTDRKDILLSIDGHAQPLSNLSAGQRMMLALVADIAIKAVTQNNFLVPADTLTDEDEPLPRVLAQTTGVVLIDELDVHLHPRWQRRVAHDLKSTFPSIQFVCTSHSPQIIGELPPEEIRLLDDSEIAHPPAHSFGLDSNAILEDVMNADARNRMSREAIEAVEQALDVGDLELGRERLEKLKHLQHGETEDTSRLEATINNLEAFADAGD